MKNITLLNQKKNPTGTMFKIYKCPSDEIVGRKNARFKVDNTPVPYLIECTTENTFNVWNNIEDKNATLDNLSEALYWFHSNVFRNKKENVELTYYEDDEFYLIIKVKHS